MTGLEQAVRILLSPSPSCQPPLLLLQYDGGGEDELDDLRLESAKSMFLTFMTLAVVLS